jgi:hypothetical protein
LVVRLTAAGTSGAFSVDASIDSSFAFSATAAPGAGGGGEILTFTVTPVLPPAVASDASIAWWMYLAGALVGGLTLVGVLAAIDAFSGLLLSGAIATAVGGALPTIAAPVPLPGRVPALAVRALRATQADSTRRTITLFPGATLTDPFRSHDVIVNLV